MRRLLPLAFACAALSGCLAYPRPYLTTIKGQADLNGGPPIKIQAGIEKDCETYDGDTENVSFLRETTTDKDGRYSLTVFGAVWNVKNFISLTECTSHIQRFVCRPYCKKADAVDIDLLGK